VIPGHEYHGNSLAAYFFALCDVGSQLVKKLFRQFVLFDLSRERNIAGYNNYWYRHIIRATQESVRDLFRPL
jgi:hypothetical protein